MDQKIRIGVVGPRDSVQKIERVAQHFPKLELQTFSYHQSSEAIGIVHKYRDQVDLWFFSGQAPYTLVVEKGLIPQEKATYPPLQGSSLLGVWLKAHMEYPDQLTKVSLDTIAGEKIQHIQREHKLDHMHIHSFSYTGYRSPEQVVAFHQSLYEEGKSQVAFTCLKFVDEKLTELGIPCYRVIPSEQVIQLELQYLQEKGEAIWYRSAQLAIVGIEVQNDLDSESVFNHPYEWKHRELDLKHILLDFGQKINASFVQMGDGLFFLYTTRGELQAHSNLNGSLLRDVYEQSKYDIRLGIGYGRTALDAELHVRMALQYARQEEQRNAIRVDEEKKVAYLDFGQEGQETLTFSSRALGEEWEKRFKDARISPASVHKLLSFARRYQKEHVTALEVSHWLQGTERNARRILNALVKLGLAKVDGEEQSGHQGRPRKVYRLELE